MHDIKIEYLQGWGGAVLKLSWESVNAGIAKEVIPEKAYYHAKAPANAGLTAQIYKVSGTPSSITSFGFAGEPVNQVLPNLDGRESLKDAIELSNVAVNMQRLLSTVMLRLRRAVTMNL